MKNLLIILFIVINKVAFGQSNYIICDTISVADDEVFTVSDIFPEFIGGERAMVEFINSNINLKGLNLLDSKKQTTYISALIDKEGNVIQACKIKYASNKEKNVITEYDKRAIDIVLKLKFNPGYINKKPVYHIYNIPVHFYNKNIKKANKK